MPESPAPRASCSRRTPTFGIRDELLAVGVTLVGAAGPIYLRAATLTTRVRLRGLTSWAQRLNAARQREQVASVPAEVRGEVARLQLAQRVAVRTEAIAELGNASAHAKLLR